MPPPRPTVVVVDDDVSVRESLELLIQNAGWQPALFESAQEFLAQLPTLVPSCLILDVNLPDLSGLDIQQRISDEKSSMPIIFITGYGDIPTSVRAMKAGAAEFLTICPRTKAFLPDQMGDLRRISGLQDDDPEILTLARGHCCPQERRQYLELAAFYPAIAPWRRTS